MAQILFQCKDVLKIPVDHTYAWTDLTIVLSRLQGNLRRFKVFGSSEHRVNPTRLLETRYQ